MKVEGYADWNVTTKNICYDYHCHKFQISSFSSFQFLLHASSFHDVVDYVSQQFPLFLIL